MKRTRAENSVSKPQEATSKPGKKCRDSAARAPARPRKENREEKIVSPPATVSESPVKQEEAQVVWDVVGECGWWWGVEEDVLFGWFPFGEEDFLCSESRGGGVIWDDYHDIWQLQHIHEIPNSVNS